MPRTEFIDLLHPLETHAGPEWQAAYIEEPRTPEQRQEVMGLLAAWISRVSQQRLLVGEVFLQAWMMGAKGAGTHYSQNIQNWLPVIGLGIWPDRKPPQRVTAEILMECAAAMLTNKEQPLAAHAVVHVSAGPEAAQHAWWTMFGTGMTVQMLFPPNLHAEWVTVSRDVFLPGITDPLYQRERFYIPLLEAQTLAAARTKDIDQWTCGAATYIRESPEDKAILLLSRFGFDTVSG